MYPTMHKAISRSKSKSAAAVLKMLCVGSSTRLRWARFHNCSSAAAAMTHLLVLGVTAVNDRATCLGITRMCASS